MFKELEAKCKELEEKQSVVIHLDQAAPFIFKSITRVHDITIKNFVVSVMTGLIVEMTFIIFLVYNTVY